MRGKERGRTEGKEWEREDRKGIRKVKRRG